jgi:selenocysteine lyase/cysteine desulfurase
MLKNQKDKFSLEENITYLNTAYSAPLSKKAEKIGMDAVAKKSRPYQYTSDDFFSPPEMLKKKFAALIDVENHERIAIIPSVSYGIANVANNVCLKEGDEILVVGEQFPSNVYAWRTVAKKYKANIVTVAAPAETIERGKTWNERILKDITSKTAVVSIPNVHWADGTIFDLKSIRIKATEHNALLIIDGTQSIGALPFSVKEIKPDAVICAGYKWLMGSYGLGLAYYGEFFDQGQPIEDNWINRKNSEDFTGLVSYEDQYKGGAQRYNVGEMSNFNLVPILDQTVSQLIEWGPENVQQYCDEITKDAIQELRDMNCHIEDDRYRAKHLFGVKLAPNLDAEKLKDELQRNHIFVSVRGEYIRVSPHVFNTKEDLQKLVNCFKASVTA